MREAVVVAIGRSAIGKAPRGALRNTRPEDVLAQVMQGVVAQVPQVDIGIIEDFVLGTAFPEGEQGFNMARIAVARAKFPDSLCGQTINRFCSSGLQSIVTAANSIIAGQQEIVLAGGVEFMSTIQMGGNDLLPNPTLMKERPGVYVSMGITAENVAEKYGVTKEMQDHFAVKSHEKASAAQKSGKFIKEIIPIEGIRMKMEPSGFQQVEKFIFQEDEGIRHNITYGDIAKLNPVFKKDGTVSAGSCSQMSDGAAVVLLMSDQKAAQLGLRPLAIFRGYAVTGLDPELMGMGPLTAIPKVLHQTGLRKEDIHLFEINEAFASQAIACIQKLELDENKVNVNGGAIALGHPLGCTGSFLLTKMVNEMKTRKGKYGIISMCIGGGMGAAGVFEFCF